MKYNIFKIYTANSKQLAYTSEKKLKNQKV